MWTMVIQFALKMATSSIAKTAIALGINKLLEAEDDGITKDIAETMIDAIAKSKRNPTTTEVFSDAMLVLKQG